MGIAASLAIAEDGLRVGDMNWFWTGVTSFSWGLFGLFVLASDGEPLVLGAGLLAGAAVVAATSWHLERRGPVARAGT